MDIDSEPQALPVVSVTTTVPPINGPWSYMAAPGRIDAFNFLAVKEELSAVAAKELWLAYDVSGLQFMSYAMILLLHQLAVDMDRRGGRLALVGSTEKLKRQFSIYASLEPFLCLTTESWKTLKPSSGT